MDNETKAENMLLDKKLTRKKLIARVIMSAEELSNTEGGRASLAITLSKAIGDKDSSRIYDFNDDRFKRYDHDAAIERVIELLSERDSIDELKCRISELERSNEGLERMVETATEERNRAQDAAALLGATFNDYREGCRADRCVTKFERCGDVEQWSVGRDDEF